MRLADRIQGVLKNITYKPGWEFKVVNEGTSYGLREMDYLLVSYPAPSIDDPSRMVRITSPTAIGELSCEMKDEYLIATIIRDAIQYAEYHEFKEWFKYKGVTVYDPHPKQEFER
jgi:hypothetical protein